MSDHAAEIRNSLTDPRRLAEKLNLARNAKRAGSGLLIRCPWHQEKTPSCWVTRGPDGTILVKCYGCGQTGDALTLIAEVYGLDVRANFREVLEAGAGVAGLHYLVDEIRGGRPAADRPPPPPPPEPEPDLEYPPEGEVAALWSSASDPSTDIEAAGHLMGRGLDPGECFDRGLLRCLVAGSSLPRWARFGGRDWVATGHRLLARLWDAQGVLRSVRAWRVAEADSPKRLPPAGHRTSELVLANAAAHALLRGSREPRRVLVTEGEPDWVTWSLMTTDPVFGVLSGSWASGFAQRIPNGSEVVIRTHADTAGERYAEQVARSLGERVAVWRAA